MPEEVEAAKEEKPKEKKKPIKTLPEADQVLTGDSYAEFFIVITSLFLL